MYIIQVVSAMKKKKTDEMRKLQEGVIKETIFRKEMIFEYRLEQGMGIKTCEVLRRMCQARNPQKMQNMYLSVHIFL